MRTLSSFPRSRGQLRHAAFLVLPAAAARARIVAARSGALRVRRTDQLRKAFDGAAGLHVRSEPAHGRPCVGEERLVARAPVISAGFAVRRPDEAVLRTAALGAG